MAQDILRKATEEEILRERAIAREKFLQDMAYFESRYESGYDDGHAKGHAEGLKAGHAEGLKAGHAEGHAKGHAEAVKELATKFKSSGIPVEIIAENTGLTPEEIKKL